MKEHPPISTLPHTLFPCTARVRAVGRSKALLIMATNPAVSMPDAGRVREALEAIPFLVVSDIMADTDRSTHAHVRLPAAGWGEKDGTVTNSYRTISRQRHFLPLPGAATPTGLIVQEAPRRMGRGHALPHPQPP